MTLTLSQADPVETAAPVANTPPKPVTLHGVKPAPVSDAQRELQFDPQPDPATAAEKAEREALLANLRARIAQSKAEQEEARKAATTGKPAKDKTAASAPAPDLEQARRKEAAEAVRRRLAASRSSASPERAPEPEPEPAKPAQKATPALTAKPQPKPQQSPATPPAASAAKKPGLTMRTPAQTSVPPQPASLPVPAAQALTVAAPEPQAPAAQDDPAEETGIRSLIESTAARIEHRALLIATFAALRGTEVPMRDVAEYMWLNAPGDVTIKALANALDNTGVRPRILHRAAIRPEAWPALTMMTNGQCVLVLEQSGETLVIFDTTRADNRAEVPVGEFEPFFSGTILTGRTPLKQIAARHIPEIKANHWFWGEFPKYRRQVTEIMVGSLVANLLAVAVALFSLQVYDRVIPHQSQATLWVLTVGVMLAISLEAALKLARARLTDAAGRQVELSVQKSLMQRLVGMRSDKRPLPPSGLFAAMREFGSVREFFTSSTISTMADVPFVAVFLLLVASIAGPTIVGAIILGGILMLLPAYFMQKRMIELTRQTQGANAKAGRLLHEVVTELDTLKTQRGEERMMQLWQELNEVSSHSTAEQRRLSNMLTYWSQGVQQATYITAVVLGTFMVFAGEFTVGTIIATGILTSRTLAPLTQFAGTLARWGNVKNALEGLDTIAHAPQEKESERSYLRREYLQGTFELKELAFRYEDDGAPILDLPGIQINPGQRIAVLGPNGSGKSTLLKLLSGLYSPDKGRVLIDGTDMGQIDPRDLRRNIGYLSQEVRLLAGTLRDNLNLTMLERDDERLLQALDFAGLGAYVRGHHKGLDMEIQDGGMGLSIGQRQSIGWARLWLQDPRIVLLDEPTAALDQTLEAALVQRLEAWLQGRTAVIATHRLPILQLTNRVLILQSGRMVVDGPRDQVLAHLSGGAT